MGEKNELEVGGFRFGSYEDAKAALREMKNAQYLDERVSTMSAKQLEAVYNRMLDQKVFNTPVGWEYLKYLRAQMEKAGMNTDELRPISLYTTFVTDKEDNKSYEHVAKMYIKPPKSELQKVKRSFRFSVLLNFFLVILVIAMFIITLSSPSPNILNYKTAIENKYASWEQELTERENAVRAKEALLEDTDG